MAGPLFPNVPDAPGVPPVNRDASNPGTDTTAPVSSDGAGVAASDPAPLWGLYDSSNNPVIVSDNVASIGYVKEYDEPDYPQEDGAFQTYNKVERAYDIRLRLTRGGDDADRTDFIMQCIAATASYDLYSVVMPEFVFYNGNVTHHEFDRSAERGAGLLTADLRIKEVRMSATAAFSATATAQPGATSNVDSGAVQATPLTQAQAAAIVSGAQ